MSRTGRGMGRIFWKTGSQSWKWKFQRCPQSNFKLFILCTLGWVGKCWVCQSKSEPQISLSYMQNSACMSILGFVDGVCFRLFLGNVLLLIFSMGSWSRKVLQTCINVNLNQIFISHLFATYFSWNWVPKMCKINSLS